jgi:hypothetical protein
LSDGLTAAEQASKAGVRGKPDDVIGRLADYADARRSVGARAWFDPMKSLFGIGAFTALDLVRGAMGARTSAMLVICRKAA